MAGQPFRLACILSDPATDDEVGAAWPDIPDDLRALWAASRDTRLCEDVDYGQWGLHLLSPGASARRTATELEGRSRDFTEDDVVIGEFLGDQDLLVRARSPEDEVLVALPLDERSDWYRVGSDLGQFLTNYLDADGRKYWEQD